MKRYLLIGLLGAATLFTMPASARTDVDIILNFGPPPVRYEPPPRWRANYVWVPGHWDYRGYRHVWVRGHYVPQRSGYYWNQARWIERDGRWALERGGWRRDHGNRYGHSYGNRYDHSYGNRYGLGDFDRDRDGVPDQFDRYPRDRDNDGIPDYRDRYPDNRWRG